MTAVRGFDTGVTLLGGGPWREADLRRALALAPGLVCADGGANRLRGDAGRAPWPVPDMIVGDLDSLDDIADWQQRLGGSVVAIAEQDSTDFQKCLRVVEAPFFIGVGFTGGRVDHELAVLGALIGAGRPVVLLGEADVVFAPLAGRAAFPAVPGMRVSVFPLLPVTGRSTGLRWPLDGLALAAGGVVATSNEAISDQVTLAFDGAGAIVLLPAEQLGAALTAIGASG